MNLHFACSVNLSLVFMFHDLNLELGLPYFQMTWTLIHVIWKYFCLGFFLVHDTMLVIHYFLSIFVSLYLYLSCNILEKIFKALLTRLLGELFPWLMKQLPWVRPIIVIIEKQCAPNSLLNWNVSLGMIEFKTISLWMQFCCWMMK